MQRWARLTCLSIVSALLTVQPIAGASPPALEAVRPRTGGQLYAQRMAILQAGQWPSRVSPSAFVEQWQTASQQPTHQNWQSLLTYEAETLAQHQAHQPVTVLVGDSLYLWLPQEYLAGDRLWLNQSISGETTAQMLGRLGYFAPVRPQSVYVLAGANDLKNGADPAVVVSNLELIAQRLRVQHPRSRLVVLSILPTRLPEVPPQRVQAVNRQLAIALPRRGAEFLDVQAAFADDQGLLRPELTTDGLHLSPQGYSLLAAYLR